MGQSRLHAAKTTRGPSDTRALREEKLKPVMGSCSSTNLTLYRPQHKKVVLGHCQNRVSQSPLTSVRNQRFLLFGADFFIIIFTFTDINATANPPSPQIGHKGI